MNFKRNYGSYILICHSSLETFYAVGSIKSTGDEEPSLALRKFRAMIDRSMKGEQCKSSTKLGGGEGCSGNAPKIRTGDPVKYTWRWASLSGSGI